jgi:hypothetical protein
MFLDLAAVTFVPTVAISGLIRPSREGPRPLEPLIAGGGAAFVWLPTVIARVHVAGTPRVSCVSSGACQADNPRLLRSTHA